MESERLNIVRKKDHSCAGRCLILWEDLRDAWTEYDNPGPTSCFRQSVRHDDTNPREDVDDSSTVEQLGIEDQLLVSP